MANEYTFQRMTSLATETLSLGGNGNPLNRGTNLIRSAFRPSDDATILGFYIPANAMMAVELKRTAEIVRKANQPDLANRLYDRGVAIEKAIWEHGVVSHKKYGNVFAYEVDGYGSSIIMDDANLPSLLSLPKLGFLDSSDETYQNTRNMLLSKEGNPYYLQGRSFHGIGGPHIGLQNAWPMSLLVQALTSDDDGEIMEALKLVKRASRLGLIHESIRVNKLSSYTRKSVALPAFANTDGI
jgi:meiotically up-regulated gene 157 (Mug157) protein